jgi:polysaccharide biosynthesis/export protein
MKDKKCSSSALTAVKSAPNFNTFVLVVVWLISFGAIQAQQGTAITRQSAQLPAPTAETSARVNDRYRIGPEDILDIRVFNRPQLSREAARVDGEGFIRMPFIDTEVPAACRTENELASDIANYYRKYQNNPQVTVFVKEYKSQPVAVIGSVILPGRFQLQRRVRLLEVLTFAGGPSPNAGRTIQVVHEPKTINCEDPSDSSAEANGLTTTSYELNSVLRGDESSNPYVRAGDVISVMDAEQVFVVGNVLKPTMIPLREPVTISRAIAMAGGLLPDTKTDKIRIVRLLPGGNGKQEILVDLKAIEKQQAPDIVLQADDIVNVPVSGTKRFLLGLGGGLTQLPMNIIR